MGVICDERAVTMPEEPGDEHGPARRGCGSLEGGGFAASGATLVAFAADVEQRVVDADGQADQDHERARGVAERRDLRDDAEPAWTTV